MTEPDKMQQATQALEKMLDHFSLVNLGQLTAADSITRNIAYEAVKALKVAIAEPVEQTVLKPLTEKKILEAIHSCGVELQGRITMTYESGPDDIDKPTHVAVRLVREIEAAHNISKPQIPKPMTRTEINCLAYDLNALPEDITDKTLVDFVRAIEAITSQECLK